MDALDVLKNLATRPSAALTYFWEALDPSRINWRPGGHPNSIAWLMWHTARQADAQISPLAGMEECWTEQRFMARFGLSSTNLGLADTGFSQDADAARTFFVPETQAGKDLLYDYFTTVYTRLARWIDTLDAVALDRVIDTSWDPPVTVGIRIISVLDDAAQHIGQAAYIAGTVEVVDLTR